VYRTATPDQLAGFRQRFAPVVDAVGREPGNEQTLARVRAAAGDTPNEAAAYSCAGTPSPSPAHGG
jgi:hypothetical protein